MLMMAPFYKLPEEYMTATDGFAHAKLQRCPLLALSLLVFLTSAESDTLSGGLFHLTVNLVPVFMARSGYSKPLIRFLETLFLQQTTRVSDRGHPLLEFTSPLMVKYFRTLTPSVSQYFEVRIINSSTCQQVES